MDDPRYCLSGPILSGVHHDRHNRREGGSRPLPASVRAVAGGASVVPVRPPRYPCDCGAQRGRHTGCPGIVSRAWCPGPFVRARCLCLRIFPRRSAGRRAWLARFCAAPAAVHARSSGRDPNPRPSLGLWHLPLFFTPWNVLTTFNLVVFVLATTCLAIMYTWVFNNTKGSVLMAILIHASFNASVTGILAPLFPAPILEDYGLLPILGGFGAFAVVLVALTRGRLGYQHYQQEEEEPDPATAST